MSEINETATTAESAPSKEVKAGTKKSAAKTSAKATATKASVYRPFKPVPVDESESAVKQPILKLVKAYNRTEASVSVQIGNDNDYNNIFLIGPKMNATLKLTDNQLKEVEERYKEQLIFSK